MTFRDLKWSKAEKKIAREAFDKAYDREMMSIKKEVYHILENLKEDHGIWKLEDYLRKKRREIDEKYDYRYSMLILVFARLISDGFLTKSDLEGLSEDKLLMINRILE